MSYALPSFEFGFSIVKVGSPSLTAHPYGIYINYLFITLRNYLTAIESLASMESCRRGISCNHRREEGITEITVDIVFVSVHMNLEIVNRWFNFSR